MPRPMRLPLALGCLILLACSTGCSAVREATRAGLEAARAYYAEHKAELKAELKAEGAALLAETKVAVLAEGRAYSDAQVAKLTEAFAGHGVDASKIDSIAAGLQAIKQVQEEEKKSGKPYQPVTGSLITDVIAAYLLSKAGIGGASMLAAKKGVPAPAPPAPAP